MHACPKKTPLLNIVILLLCWRHLLAGKQTAVTDMLVTYPNIFVDFTIYPVDANCLETVFIVYLFSIELVLS